MSAVLEAIDAELDRLDALIAETQAQRDRTSEARRLLTGDDPTEASPKKRKAKRSGSVECPDCGKTLKSSSGLGPHRRNCPGPRPRAVPDDPPGISVDPPDGAVFACSGCGKSFLASDRLADHKRYCAAIEAVAS